MISAFLKLKMYIKSDVFYLLFLTWQPKSDPNLILMVMQSQSDWILLSLHHDFHCVIMLVV